ncbi:MAG: YicC family protein [Lachnospiraceae bacterium]|nr:YicC family protein [Lachnospiraceae bacterium]
MLKSMTGFGRFEAVSEERKLVVEIKSVNHRYSDISIRLPKKLSFLETAVRNKLKEYISRGKVDVFIGYEDYTEGKVCVKYNEELALAYWNNLNKLSRKLQMENDVTIAKLSRYPEVFSLEEQNMDEEEIWTFLEEVVEKAAEKFVQSRIDEGQHLKNDIFQKTEVLLELVFYIEERYPQMLKDYREKLTNKVKEILGDKQIDEAVLATELIVYSDKVCVDEETVRLRSHITNLRNTMEQEDNIGRKLDFIAQEMNREANTILSKANDMEVSARAIDLKTEIEKIREQIQNIE